MAEPLIVTVASDLFPVSASSSRIAVFSISYLSQSKSLISLTWRLIPLLNPFSAPRLSAAGSQWIQRVTGGTESQCG